MTTVVEKHHAAGVSPLFICDFSPPRGSDPRLFAPAKDLSADFISVGYNPGKFVTVNSAMAAAWIKGSYGKDVLFTLATRDMNKLAIQSLLLGADLHGLNNVVVLWGDRFTERELEHTRRVNDFTPTGLVSSVGPLNEGTDYRGLNLRASANLCVGATIDISGDIDLQVRLTRRKIEAGAQFFLLQSVFDAKTANGFLDRYTASNGKDLDVPVFWGVPMLARDGITFGRVPEWATDDLARGRSGRDIALQILADLFSARHRRIYLMPPIVRRGPRDYESAQAVMEAARDL